jgi:acetyl-CoA synthase
MSALTDLIYKGANTVAGLTEAAVKKAIEQYGANKKISFPDTAYFFPTILSATGVKVEKLSILNACVGVMKGLIANKADLNDAFKAGLATAVGAEILEGLKYVDGGNPYRDGPGIGFVPDTVIRSLGVPLVTGDIPGVAVILGEAADPGVLAYVVREYQNKGILSFLTGKVIDQAAAQNIKMGVEFRVVPLGYDVTAVIHVVTVAIRAALIFGNIKEGNLTALIKYTGKRVPAFVNTFGPLDEVTIAAGAGAIALGFPVISDWDTAASVAIPGMLEYAADSEAIIKKSLELRNIKVKAKKISIPIACASAYEGEIIRKNDMAVEFSSSHNTACELLVMKDPASIEDHKITVIGNDIGGIKTYPVNMALAVYVEVSGARMKTDFEPVIERKIHHWVNYIEGMMHTGQRNMLRVRISKEALEKGFRLKDLGEVIYTMIRDEFAAVVDKCQVTLITDEVKATELLKKEALPRYEARDSRLASMTDENATCFYSCILCQSFAPSHCCIITPERLGLCGAVSWLDASATKQLVDTGPCQPIAKTGVQDQKKGIFDSVNKAVEAATSGWIKRMSLYSIMEDPMTSCGCFECICGIMPEGNGVVVVNREYKGVTPNGMTFGELATMTGGGSQTPGFMGHGRHFITSKKFIHAEGGVARIVWMPKELKDDVAAKLDKTAKELYDIDGFSGMICDESVATDIDGVLAFLKEKHHPALNMKAIM